MTNASAVSDTTIDVAVIGAGPYGLSIAAYLKARGVDFRIFGSPMSTWLNQMPQGMRLKSEGHASSLYDPNSAFTLAHFCSEKGIRYADEGYPIPLNTFTSYGLEFQKKFVPQLENKQVVSLRRSSPGFQIELEDGEQITARKVVMAVGLSHFDYIPEVFNGLPRELVTHSSGHCCLNKFKGREVAVIGAGASAVDVAAILHSVGASTHLIARPAAIRFHDPPGKLPRPLLSRIRHPRTGLGPGWKLAFYAHAPLIFRHLPEKVRLEKVKTVLGPAPGWFVKDEVVGKVAFHLGAEISKARVENGRVVLDFTDAGGKKQTLLADHVISATGYKVDLQRLAFMDSDLRSCIETVALSPALSPHFESTCAGLYFVGTAAAHTFGPLMRFAVGAQFAARQISRHLAS
ncbi:MAG TPA: NAD(P)/FAD-dependent oxidoreductase [Candidatus Acidoferrum sp.]